MKAVQLMEIGKPLKMQDVPLPTVGDRDILVRIQAAGICHSDVHYRAGTSPVGPLPQTLGTRSQVLWRRSGRGWRTSPSAIGCASTTW